MKRIPIRTDSCIVTGAAGFIGSNLACTLDRNGADVIAVDDFSTGKRTNMDGFGGKMIKHNMCFPLKVKGDIDAIFHQAAITDPRYSNGDELLLKNLLGFLNAVRLARQFNAKLVYASSASLYGNGKTPMKETQHAKIFSKYAKSKLVCDNLVKQSLCDRMRIVGLRYFNVYGPGESYKGRPASMIYHLAKTIKAGQTPKLFKWGEQKRDHIYVEDCVTANLLALSAKSGVYNVGTGVATTFNDLLDMINAELGTSVKPIYINNPYKGTYQSNTQADTKLAEKCLKFKARYTLKRGIHEYLPLI